MARLTASVVFPTPPLPEPTATIAPTPGKGCGDGGCCPGRGGSCELISRLYGNQRSGLSVIDSQLLVIGSQLSVHTARYPPSTGNAAPVTHDDSSLARYTASPHMSSGVPRRPMG